MTTHHLERRRGRRVPFRPLEDWLNARYRNPSADADDQNGGELTATTIGHLVGVTRQTLYRWRNNGIPWWSADAAAIHAGRRSSQPGPGPMTSFWENAWLVTHSDQYPTIWVAAMPRQPAAADATAGAAGPGSRGSRWAPGRRHPPGSAVAWPG